MAAESTLVLVGDLTASADCSAHQFCFVYISGNGTFTFSSGATVVPLGILQNKPISGEAGSIAVAGISKFKCGAGVTAQARLMADSNGAGITATGSGAVSGGICVVGTSNINEIGECAVNVANHVFP